MADFYQECSTHGEIAYPGYVIVNPGAIDHPLQVEVPLSPADPNGPNILCIYSGTAVCGIKADSSSAWTRHHMLINIPTGRQWVDLPPNAPILPSQTRFLGGTAMAAPAAMFNKNVANNAGWAVDATWVQVDRELQVGAHIAVRDSDGYLYRVSYHVTALGRHG
jgi:hypothetical protein